MSRKRNKQAKRRQPSRNVIDEVASRFDPAMLADVCTREHFGDYADRVDLDRPGRFYWHADNGSNVLAVAHLDHVQDDARCQVIDTASGPLAVSGALDDRLGAYVILDLLPRLGIECDILLTTDEERGNSTAGEFITDKPYNWMIEFDRGGTDVVMYQYETPALAALVTEAGARVGQGSYSDIADLDHLECAAFNWGVGYQDYHSPRAHAWLADTFKMVARFVKFYEANSTTYLPHDPRAGSRKWWWTDDAYYDDRALDDLDDIESYDGNGLDSRSKWEVYRAEANKWDAYTESTEQWREWDHAPMSERDMLNALRAYEARG